MTSTSKSCCVSYINGKSFLYFIRSCSFSNILFFYFWRCTSLSWRWFEFRKKSIHKYFSIYIDANDKNLLSKTSVFHSLLNRGFILDSFHIHIDGNCFLIFIAIEASSKWVYVAVYAVYDNNAVESFVHRILSKNLLSNNKIFHVSIERPRFFLFNVVSFEWDYLVTLKVVFIFLQVYSSWKSESIFGLQYDNNNPFPKNISRESYIFSELLHASLFFLSFYAHFHFDCFLIFKGLLSFNSSPLWIIKN